MTTLAQVRTAMATAIDGITNLRAIAYVPDAVASNQAVIIRGEIDYDLVMADRPAAFNYTIAVYAPRAAERASQVFLDTLCEPTGATSIKATLEADAALAALVDYVVVKKASEVGVANVGDGEGAVTYLTVSFTVEVCIS